MFEADLKSRDAIRSRSFMFRGVSFGPGRSTVEIPARDEFVIFVRGMIFVGGGNRVQSLFVSRELDSMMAYS